MTSNEYQGRANALAAQADNAVKERLVLSAKRIDVGFEQCKVAGDRLDEIKKFAFYNRQNDAASLASTFPAPFGNEEANQRLRDNADLVHAVLGVLSECAELADALMKHISTGAPLDGVNVLEELGDIDWYKVLALKAIGYTNEECQIVNINKLESRYKGGFSQRAANNRDLDTERKILENVQKDVNS